MRQTLEQKCKGYYDSSPFIQNNLPYILIGFANCFWSLAWIYYNEHSFTIAEASLSRGIVTVFLNYLIIYMFDIPVDFKEPKNFRLLFFRNLIMAVHGFMMVISQYFLPLPIVHTIAMSGVSWTFVIDYFKNGVKINKKQLIGVILSFVGVLITSNGR